MLGQLSSLALYVTSRLLVQQSLLLKPVYETRQGMELGMGTGGRRRLEAELALLLLGGFWHTVRPARAESWVLSSQQTADTVLLLRAGTLMSWLSKMAPPISAFLINALWHFA